MDSLDHGPVIIQRSSKKQKVFFSLFVGAAVVVVMFGWAFTVWKDVKQNAMGVRSEFTSAASAASSIGDQTEDSRESLRDATEQFREFAGPFFAAAAEKNEALKAVTEKMIETIEADAQLEAEAQLLTEKETVLEDSSIEEIE